MVAAGTGREVGWSSRLERHTDCRLFKSSSPLPHFIVASIEPTVIGTFCCRQLSWYSERPDCTWLGLRLGLVFGLGYRLGLGLELG